MKPDARPYAPLAFAATALGLAIAAWHAQASPAFESAPFSPATIESPAELPRVAREVEP